jgi:hypothetical protein
MINSVGRRTIAAAVRDQLHIHLPWDVIMLDGPITEYGEFKVGGAKCKGRCLTAVCVCVCVCECARACACARVAMSAG